MIRKFKMEEMGKVSHGIITSRVEAKGNVDSEEFKIFTMQELSYLIGQFDVGLEEQVLNVDINKFDRDNLTREGDIMVGLTSHKCIVITKDNENKIITSNFAYIRVNKNMVDPYYLTWCINESYHVRKQLNLAIQGSILKVIPVAKLRELQIRIPDLETQKKIGEIYRLRFEKKLLQHEKSILEDKIMNQQFLDLLKEAEN